MKKSATYVRALEILNALKNDRFYSDDIGVQGGTINGLVHANIIKATGSTRPVIIARPNDPDNPIIREAKEWEIDRRFLKAEMASVEA